MSVSRRDLWVHVTLSVATIGAILFATFRVSGLLLPDPLGGPFKLISQEPKFKDGYIQAMALIVNGLSDIGIYVTIGLFVIVGTAIGFRGQRYELMSGWRLIPLSLFLVAAVLAIFGAIRFKADFLLQIQFDRIDIHLLTPALVGIFVAYWVRASAVSFLLYHLPQQRRRQNDKSCCDKDFVFNDKDWLPVRRELRLQAFLI